MSNLVNNCVQYFNDISGANNSKRQRRKVSFSPIWNLLADWGRIYIITLDAREIITLTSVSLLSFLFQNTTMMVMMTILLTANASLPSQPDIKFIRILIAWGCINIVVNSIYICLRCLTVFTACVVIIPTVRSLCGKQIHPTIQSFEKRSSRRVKATVSKIDRSLKKSSLTV